MATTEAQAIEALNEAIAWHQKESRPNIGILGYSEGAEGVLRHLQSGTTAVKAAFVATPSITTDLTLLAGIQRPISIALSDEYDINNTTTQWIDVSRDLKNSSQPYQINVYSHVHTGFAQRRNGPSKADRLAKKSAFTQAITWFEEFLTDGL